MSNYSKIMSVLTVACFLCWTIGYFTGKGTASYNHVHGWSKWEDDGKPFVNPFGQYIILQHRVCTNCGYFEGVGH